MRQMLRFLTLPLATGILLSTAGCATYSSQKDLDERVAKLELKVEALETHNRTVKLVSADRLKDCIEVEADLIYWNHVKLNGKEVSPGRWRADESVFKNARQRKLDKIDECKILYGQ